MDETQEVTALFLTKNKPFGGVIGVVEANGSEEEPLSDKLYNLPNTKIVFTAKISEEESEFLQDLFVESRRRGDEIRRFRSEGASWPLLAGSAGYVLVRNGEVVSRYTLYRS